MSESKWILDQFKILKSDLNHMISQNKVCILKLMTALPSLSDKKDNNKITMQNKIEKESTEIQLTFSFKLIKNRSKN